MELAINYMLSLMQNWCIMEFTITSDWYVCVCVCAWKRITTQSNSIMLTLSVHRHKEKSILITPSGMQNKCSCIYCQSFDRYSFQFRQPAEMDVKKNTIHAILNLSWGGKSLVDIKGKLFQTNFNLNIFLIHMFCIFFLFQMNTSTIRGRILVRLMIKYGHCWRAWMMFTK